MITWRTSLASQLTENCVEVGMEKWHKSSASGGWGQCVETAADANGMIHVRNSSDREGPCVQFTPDEWRAFLDGVKKDEFDV